MGLNVYENGICILSKSSELKLYDFIRKRFLELGDPIKENDLEDHEVCNLRKNKEGHLIFSFDSLGSSDWACIIDDAFSIIESEAQSIFFCSYIKYHSPP